MLTQNKKRLFEKNKSEYTFRSLNSIVLSLNSANKFFPNVKFDIIVIDHNSKNDDIEIMKNLLNKSNFKNSIIKLDVSEFDENIKKTILLWQPRSKIESISDSFLEYQIAYGKNVGVIRQTPPIKYYFNKKNIHYTSFANIDELLSSTLDFDLIISRDLNKENYHKVKGYELLFIGGWADSFYILYKDKKHFNNST